MSLLKDSNSPKKELVKFVDGGNRDFASSSALDLLSQCL